MSLSSKDKGDIAEKQAADYLRHRGYRIRARNFRSRWGEIDLICEKGGCLVFVEVKASASRYHGVYTPSGRVDFRKQQRIMRTAEYYLAQNTAATSLQPRFDVLEVLMDKAYQQAGQITHLKNAFPK